MFLKSLMIFCGIGLTSTCLAGGDKGITGIQEARPLPVGKKRPLRVGFMKMAPDLDAQKPLAPVDYAGWIEHSGFLIGSSDGKKVTASAIKNKTVFWNLPISSDLTIPVFPVGDAVILAFQDGALMKVELSTGRPLWQIKPSASFVATSLSKDNEHIFAATASQVLYAINLHDGKIDWLYDPEIPGEILVHNTAPPLVSVNVLYWGLSTGEIVALEGKTGKALWRRNPQLGGGGRFHNYMASMFLSGKRLLFCRYDGLVGAASIESGQEGELLWKVEGVTGNCTASDYRSGRFYAVTTNGNLHAVSVANGKDLWQPVKLGSALSSVSAVEDYIFVTGIDGQIFALTPNGELSWFDDIGGRTLTRPFFVGKNVYLTTGLKNIYVYRFD